MRQTASPGEEGMPQHGRRFAGVATSANLASIAGPRRHAAAAHFKYWFAANSPPYSLIVEHSCPVLEASSSLMASGSAP